MRRVGFPVELRGVAPLVRAQVFDIPESFTGRGRWQSGPMHTFVDDYRQDFFWRRPAEGLLIAAAAGFVTAPDFTIYNDDPVTWRGYQAWRSAMVAAYWQAAGVKVLPVVSFGSGCAELVERGAIWAVRAPNRYCTSWLWDLERWAKEAKPAGLVVFGRRVAVELGIPVIYRQLSGKCRSEGTAAQKEGAR